MRRRIIIAAIAAVLFLGVLYGGGALLWFSIPTLPPAPELQSVDLRPVPPGPRSEPLHAFLGNGRPLQVGPVATRVDEGRAAIREARWLHDAQSTLRALRPLEPLLASFMGGLEGSGCLEAAPVGAAGDPVLVFHAAVEALTVRSVALVQLGRRAEGLDVLVRLLAGLLRVQSECPSVVLLTALNQTAIGLAHGAAGHVLADPELSDEHRVDLLHRLAVAEVAPSPWSDAVRREYEHTSTAFSALRGSEEAPELLASRRRCYQRLLWLALQPADSPALTHPTPEEVYLQELSRWPPWLLSLRLGGPSLAGLYLGEAALVATRPRLGAQERCRWAARRARWLAALTERGLVAETESIDSPINPFSGETITRSSSLDCRLRGRSLVWEELAGLPEPPPARD